MKRCVTILIVLLISCFYMPRIHVLAINMNQTEYNSKANEASNASQFLDWLEKNENAGGTLTLTNDIHIDKLHDSNHYRSTFAILQPNDPKPMTVNTNGHHIYIDKGAIYGLYAPYDEEIGVYNLTITGVGGEEGLLHIREGGNFSMYGIKLNATDHKKALVQEEGSMVEYYGRYYGTTLQENYNVVENGTLSFSKNPMVMEPIGSMENIVLGKMEKQTSTDTIQQDCRVEASWNGYYTDDALLDITWNTSSIQEPKLNKYYDVQGRYSSLLSFPTFEDTMQYLTMGQLTARFILTQRQFAITAANIHEYDECYDITFEYEYAAVPSSAVVMVKTKDEDWKVFEDMDMKYFEYNAISFETNDLSSYYCIEVEYDGEYYSSNVVSLEDGVFVTHDDIDGSRGGTSTPPPPLTNQTPDEEDTLPEQEQEEEDEGFASSDEDSKNPTSENEDTVDWEETIRPPKVDMPFDSSLKNDNTLWHAIVNLNKIQANTETPSNNVSAQPIEARVVDKAEKESVLTQKRIQTKVKKVPANVKTYAAFALMILVVVIVLVVNRRYHKDVD